MTETRSSTQASHALVHIRADIRGTSPSRHLPIADPVTRYLEEARYNELPSFIDLHDTFEGLAELFRWAYIIGEPMEGEHRPLARYLEEDFPEGQSSRARAAGMLVPRVIRMNMGSLLDVLAAIDIRWLLGGGLVGLATFAEHYITLPMRVSAKWAELAAEREEAHLRREQAQADRNALAGDRGRGLAAKLAGTRIDEISFADPDEPDEDLEPLSR
jgi:hypothetical protein